MNVVCLMGRLTADPEVRQTPNGISVCSFSVAVNRRYSGANGERQADFINCVAWRQTAEFIGRYFRKGNMIGLNGSIQTRTYQDKDTGKNRTAFEVVINNAYFAESKGGSSQGTQSFNNNSYNSFAQPGPKADNNFQANSFSTGDLDGFSALAADDGDLPF